MAQTGPGHTGPVLFLTTDNHNDMNRYQYKGTDCNLGRFGPVRTGDVLLFTDQETDDISGDKRFRRLAESEKIKSGVFIKITDKMTAEERAAAEQANRVETERVATLDKENNVEKVEILDLKTKSFDELAAIAANINAEAKGTIIDIGRKTSRGELLRQLLGHKRNVRVSELPPDDDEEEPAKSPGPETVVMK